MHAGETSEVEKLLVSRSIYTNEILSHFSGGTTGDTADFKPLAITGMMGAGKTSIIQQLCSESAPRSSEREEAISTFIVELRPLRTEDGSEVVDWIRALGRLEEDILSRSQRIGSSRNHVSGFPNFDEMRQAAGDIARSARENTGWLVLFAVAGVTAAFAKDIIIELWPSLNPTTTKAVTIGLVIAAFVFAILGSIGPFFEWQRRRSARRALQDAIGIDITQYAKENINLRDYRDLSQHPEAIIKAFFLDLAAHLEREKSGRVRLFFDVASSRPLTSNEERSLSRGVNAIIDIFSRPEPDINGARAKRLSTISGRVDLAFACESLSQLIGPRQHMQSKFRQIIVRAATPKETRLILKRLIALYGNPTEGSVAEQLMRIPDSLSEPIADPTIRSIVKALTYSYLSFDEKEPVFELSLPGELESKVYGFLNDFGSHSWDKFKNKLQTEGIHANPDKNAQEIVLQHARPKISDLSNDSDHLDCLCFLALFSKSERYDEIFGSALRRLARSKEIWRGDLFVGSTSELQPEVRDRLLSLPDFDRRCLAKTTAFLNEGIGRLIALERGKSRNARATYLEALTALVEASAPYSRLKAHLQEVAPLISEILIRVDATRQEKPATAALARLTQRCQYVAGKLSLCCFESSVAGTPLSLQPLFAQSSEIALLLIKEARLFVESADEGEPTTALRRSMERALDGAIALGKRFRNGNKEILVGLKHLEEEIEHALEFIAVEDLHIREALRPLREAYTNRRTKASVELRSALENALQVGAHSYSDKFELELAKIARRLASSRISNLTKTADGENDFLDINESLVLPTFHFLTGVADRMTATDKADAVRIEIFRLSIYWLIALSRAPNGADVMSRRFQSEAKELYRSWLSSQISKIENWGPPSLISLASVMKDAAVELENEEWLSGFKKDFNNRIESLMNASPDEGVLATLAHSSLPLKKKWLEQVSSRLSIDAYLSTSDQLKRNAIVRELFGILASGYGVTRDSSIFPIIKKLRKAYAQCVMASLREYWLQCGIANREPREGALEDAIEKFQNFEWTSESGDGSLLQCVLHVIETLNPEHWEFVPSDFLVVSFAATGTIRIGGRAQKTDANVPENLLPVPIFQSLNSASEIPLPPNARQRLMFANILSSRSEGRLVQTCRGPEYCAKVMQLLFPVARSWEDAVPKRDEEVVEYDSGVPRVRFRWEGNLWTAASNSCLIMRMAPENKALIIRNAGVLHREIQDVLQLRRFVVFEEADISTANHEVEAREVEIRRFVEGFFKDAKVSFEEDGRVVLMPKDGKEVEDVRKVRTFLSAFQKVFGIIPTTQGLALEPRQTTPNI